MDCAPRTRAGYGLRLRRTRAADAEGGARGPTTGSSGWANDDNGEGRTERRSREEELRTGGVALDEQNTTTETYDDAAKTGQAHQELRNGPPGHGDGQTDRRRQHRHRASGRGMLTTRNRQTAQPPRPRIQPGRAPRHRRRHHGVRVVQARTGPARAEVRPSVRPATHPSSPLSSPPHFVRVAAAAKLTNSCAPSP